MPRIAGPLAATVLTIALSAQAADLAEGIDLYRNHCAACHGADGDGDGPAAPAMRTMVPNLRVLAHRNGDVFPNDAVTAYIDGRELRAAHGDREMPIWGDVFRSPDQKLARERIDSLVEFLKILYFQLGAAAKDAFPVAWDKFMGAGSYAGRIELAKANGMVVNPNVGMMTLAGLIMGFWIFDRLRHPDLLRGRGEAG